MPPSADDLSRRIEVAAERALTDIARDLRSRATQRAPIDTGTLRGSADHQVRRTIGGIEAVVSFNTPYAWVQHERTDFNHPRGGEAKYLQTPLQENIRRYEDNLKRAVREAVRKVVR